MIAVIDPIASHARHRPRALALHELASGRRWTYDELDAVVDRVAALLVERLGPASGARVATLARNCAEMLLINLACVRAGAIFVPLNWRLAPPEIEVLIDDAAPSLIFHAGDLTPPGTVGRRLTIESLLDHAERAPERPPADARRAFDAPSTLLYTSGTSGRPKGVIVTEANAFWGATNFIHGNGVSGSSVFLCDMPLFHTAGLLAAARTPLLAGATVLLSTGFDAPVTLSRLADPALAITHYFSVPQMAQRMWDLPQFDPAMLGRLSVYAMGGAPNPAAQIERFVRAGVAMSDGFGMSETGSNFGMPVADPDLLLAKAGSCGLPYLSVSARIVDDDGRDAPDGVTGELWLSGPSVTSGYWQQPELTARAFTDGWFRTGDAAMRDPDGFYFLVDRKKDMFISGGENVYPAEVEAVLAELEAVAEAAVIGVPDDRWGEVGRAYVVAADGRELLVSHVLEHCATRLARFKTPATVVITASIPRTASGKVQKHILKAQAKAELA